MIRVFIDGRAGTTGLQIEERLLGIPEIQLLDIGEAERKNPAARRERYAEADAVFFCLPDEAAREAADLAQGTKAVLFDASTAHRTHPDWVYGFPELSPTHRERLRNAGRIAVPGCHASGFCALIYPLIQTGLLSPEEAIPCFSLTGYSGGGKALITEYESPEGPKDARPYALGLRHKHLPEMQAVCALSVPPVFVPVLAPVRQGMLVSVLLGLAAEPLHAKLADWYETAENVRVMPFGLAPDPGGRLSMEACNGEDNMELFVYGHENGALLTARLDNLGKGASGAAVQCLRLRFGL